MNRIVLISLPGAGKGTLAEMIASRLELSKIVAGDLVRAEVAACTDTGNAVKDLVSRGMLVPDETIIRLINDRIAGNKFKRGYILDGFPRTLVQARMLETLPVDREYIVYLEIPREVIIQRTLNRIVCRNCGAIYNLLTMPPARDNLCDKCNGYLGLRADDSQEIITRRLEVFTAQTAPILEYYQEKGVLLTIDAQGSPEEVYSRFQEIYR